VQVDVVLDALWSGAAQRQQGAAAGWIGRWRVGGRAVEDEVDLLAEQFLLAPPEQALGLGVHPQQPAAGVGGEQGFADGVGDGAQALR
jgi:hypothetical protein